MIASRSAVVLLVLALTLLGTDAKEKAPECEVCQELLTLATKDVTKEEKKDLLTIEAKIQAYCDRGDISQTHKKVCYYISPIKREISKPLKNGVPIEKICSRLKKQSAEICAVTPPVKVEKGNTDYSKLRIKQLKSILRERGVTCDNCLEKKEFVQRCKETEHLEL